jgi:hypothetical protein
VSRTRRIPRLLAAALVALAGCASQDAIPISTTHDPLARVPAEATYAWDEAAISLPENPSIDPASTDALLREVANEAFAARGYRLAPPPTNYLLSYQYAVAERIGPDVSKAIGSVSLLLVESASGRRVWLGFGRAEIHVGLTPEERRARLKDALDRMLADFPPSQRPEE